MNVMLAALIVGAYLLGAIPFGVMIARAHGVDILKSGSGNPGATNVKRILGTRAGYTVFILDVLKGLIPASLARLVVRDQLSGIDPQVIWIGVGFVAVLGHCLSPFLGFKGGKGIATSLGAGVAAAPAVALAAFAVFIVLMAATHYVSLASIVAIASTIIWTFVFPEQSRQLLPVFIVLSAIIVFRHKANIGRLLKGTEPKSYFGDRGKTGAGEGEESTETNLPTEPNPDRDRLDS